MTREEAYEWNKNTHDKRFNKYEDMEESIHYLLKKIYDDFEKELLIRGYAKIPIKKANANSTKKRPLGV